MSLRAASIGAEVDVVRCRCCSRRRTKKLSPACPPACYGRDRGLIAMPKVRMSPAWFGELDLADNVEWIDTEQRGLVLRVRRGRLVWFVRYVFEAQARRYRLRKDPLVRLPPAPRPASFRRRTAAGLVAPQH